MARFCQEKSKEESQKQAEGLEAFLDRAWSSYNVLLALNHDAPSCGRFCSPGSGSSGLSKLESSSTGTMRTDKKMFRVNQHFDEPVLPCGLGVRGKSYVGTVQNVQEH